MQLISLAMDIARKFETLLRPKYQFDFYLKNEQLQKNFYYT